LNITFRQKTPVTANIAVDWTDGLQKVGTRKERLKLRRIGFADRLNPLLRLAVSAFRPANFRYKGREENRQGLLRRKHGEDSSEPYTR
jgi:hypothetical protein